MIMPLSLPDIKMLTFENLLWLLVIPHCHALTGNLWMCWLDSFYFSQVRLGPSSQEEAGQQKWPGLWFPRTSSLHRDILTREVLVYWEVSFFSEHDLSALWAYSDLILITLEVLSWWKRTERELRESWERTERDCSFYLHHELYPVVSWVPWSCRIIFWLRQEP